MKKFYSLLFLLATLPSISQIINFPDPAFKVFALGYADLDSDGEVTQEEAAFCSMLFVDGPAVSSLEGLQYFVNLTDLTVDGTSVTSISLPNSSSAYLYITDNPLLTSVTISGNVLTFDAEFHFTGNTMLESLDISGYDNSNWVYVNDNPALTSLAINQSTRYLDAHNNGLTDIDFSGSLLTICDISYNQLANVDLPDMTDEGMNQFLLNLSGNLYSSIDLPDMEFQFSNFVSAGTLVIENTNLQQLNLDRPLQLSSLSIQNNPDLAYINFRNGSEDAAIFNGEGYLYAWVEHISFENNPSLAYVCVDEIENWNNLSGSEITDGITRMSSIINDPNVVVSYYCTPAPGGDFFIANGTVRYDSDGNGCSDSDAAVPGLNITANNYFTTTATDTDGHFTAFATSSNPNLTVSIPANPYFTVTPASYSYNFNTNPVAQPEFCISPNGTHTDMSVSVIPLEDARPGFPVSYKIITRNLGTTAQAGYVTINFGSDREFTSSVVSLDQNNPGSITWTTPVLSVFGSSENMVTFTMNGPMDTPAVNLGDVTQMTAGISVPSDENTGNNSANVSQITIGSLDPNDKAVNEGPEVSLAEASNGFTYTVRFQNNGTAPAERVVIEDMIDEDLDLSTLSVLGSSHPYMLEVVGRKLVAFFENIDLPASEDDEPGSHGYITYHIKPTSAVTVGSQFSNTASIFFDYNFPIVTNEVVTEVVLLGTSENTQDDNMKMFPNPARNLLNVMSSSGMVSVTIYSMTGQLLFQTQRGLEHQINISMLSAGTYLTEIVSDTGITNKKLIKF